jgi:2-polyprenyl-3-methyl-5-hydroxy-6-metoxy-1,4-benzoquinol methylase
MEIITSCRICKSKNIKTFFDLGQQPLANSLLKSLNEKEDFYPLSLSWCPDCNLVQLNQTVEPEKLFSEYIWVTATSKTARDFSEIFYRKIISHSPKLKEGYVLEVGSNDGTFLIPFVRDGYKVLGIDPAKNIVEIAQANGIPTKCCFFGKKVAKELLKEQGFAQIIFARNVLPHVANTRDFVDGLQTSLSNDGVLVIEVHYAKKILEELHYDSIYHEHLCYFTLKSLERLLNDFHLFIYDIEESPISGGSLIVYAKKQKVKEMSIVEFYRDQEKETKINKLESWQGFVQKAFSHRKKLLDILSNLFKNGEMIAGYGASARSSTLLNFCGIDSNLISIIADQNPLKQKLFTAGTHIPIESPEVVMAQNPKYILILAWNFTKEIIENLKNKFNYKGGIIVPLPNTPYFKEII